MNGLQVILFSLSLAFFWVEILKWGSVKPFNCLKCMTGWVSFIMAWSFGVEYFLLYLPLGVFIGALFTAIKMRWL